jgi:hypothetical protein
MRRGGGPNRWHSLVNCNHGDSSSSRVRLTSWIVSAPISYCSASICFAASPCIVRGGGKSRYLSEHDDALHHIAKKEARVRGPTKQKRRGNSATASVLMIIGRGRPVKLEEARGAAAAAAAPLLLVGRLGPGGLTAAELLDQTTHELFHALDKLDVDHERRANGVAV